jgi:hypothetical protein
VAGALNYLYQANMTSVLQELFFKPEFKIVLSDYQAMKSFVDPLETFDPESDIDLVALSPMGMVHIFRQYFFEFDTFLGTPVQHIWLSPGSTVELIEIHTRKTVTERFNEVAFESAVKSDKSLTEADELSDAIKTDNQTNTKFGVSSSVDVGVNLEVFTAEANVSSNFGFAANERKAREQLHKQTRQQSAKLATEIKKNFKSTFKTVTEVQDTTSKRYVLQNTAETLVNYELRRKMRQVGVQVQDIGTQLCWQTYVDVPGNQLGIANLVHIAEPPDLSNIKEPDAPTKLAPQSVELPISFPFQGVGVDDDEKDVTYYHGSDEESGANDNDHIVWIREYKSDPPGHGYTLTEPIDVVSQHSSTCVAEAKVLSPEGLYEIRLPQVNFDDQSSINLKVKLRWNPPDQTEAEAQFIAEKEKYGRDKERLFREAYVKAARERIKLSSNVEPRPFLELREEERIVVYRELIGSLLDVGVNLENAKTRHIASELIASMFDVDKMLYFVAEDWWRPKLHQGHQTFGSLVIEGDEIKTSTTTTITADTVVSWSGLNEEREDNYYITEESKPAKFGSSLGWLLQLDGDNLRNAFLNAPWVKAVIPIKPGKELAALNWLMHASVEGTDGLDAMYQPASAEEAQTIVDTLKGYHWHDAADQQRYGAAFQAEHITIKDALKYLAVFVSEKQRKATEMTEETLGGEPKKFLPTDKVFEHGFYPLAGGFKAESIKPFELIDQWVEVLPTDQIVAVPVQYDPKTGFQP